LGQLSSPQGKYQVSTRCAEPGRASTSGVGPNGPGQFDFASADGNDSLAQSGFGNFDTAIANGNDTLVGAGGASPTALGNNDFAAVFDPFGSVGSLADAGNGNFDLTEIFGDGLNLTLLARGLAYGGNFLYDILAGPLPYARRRGQRGDAVSRVSA
jgi:hypothetical protein